jgi:hypothetical protein
MVMHFMQNLPGKLSLLFSLERNILVLPASFLDRYGFISNGNDEISFGQIVVDRRQRRFFLDILQRPSLHPSWVGILDS